MGMTKGWGQGFKALALAAALASSGATIAQDSLVAPATAPMVAAPVIAAPVAPPSPADVAGAATTTPATPTPATPTPATTTPAATPTIESSALMGYERMAPTPGIGQPIHAGINVQQQFTPIGQEAKFLLEMVLNPLIIGICIMVLGLMLYVSVRYRSSRVAAPATTTHNFTVEVVWTLIPALILLAIAFPSFRLLANQYSPPKADLTVKVTGYQWYWGYEYPDYGGISFDSIALSKTESQASGEPYLLAVDNRLVVPAGKTVKVLVTAADVLHSFAVPSFWVKMDAVPGRINETWFKVDRPGVYYGQCSELCGTKHGFMPIAVEVLSEEDFRRWVRMKQQQDGIEPTGPGIAGASAQPSPAQVAGAVRAAVAPAGAPTITTAAPAAAPAAPAA